MSPVYTVREGVGGWRCAAGDGLCWGLGKGAGGHMDRSLCGFWVDLVG